MNDKNMDMERKGERERERERERGGCSFQRSRTAMQSDAQP